MTTSRRAILSSFLFTVCLGLGAAQAATPGQVFDFFRAVQMDDAKTVKAMAGTVVNPNEINPIGGEPGLVLALRERSMGAFDVLLAHPATNLEATAINGNTALMMAAFKQNKPAVVALLNKGAAVNRDGWTALHYAAASGDDEIARMLLQHGARVDAVSPLKSGAYTPLMMAAREGHESTALMLIDQGAKPGLKNSEGLTAAQIAERAGKPGIAAAIAARRR
jgi:ankyrin repeat protein